MRLRILDLDGCPAGVDSDRAELIRARDLADGLRLYAGRRAWREFRARLAQRPAPGREPEVTFYGSGDFHHLTAALVARHADPLTVLQFDNHPDWVSFPPGINCGSWVSRAMELPQVERVVTVGPASDDLVRPQLSFANLRAVEADRIRLIPWEHPPSRVLGRFGDCPSWTVRNGHLCWPGLAGRTPGEAASMVTAAIGTERVYITIDKDVLAESEAVTNWEQGGMPLGHLTAVLEAVAGRHDIVGLDVCGDWSPPRFRDPVRWAISRTDRAAKTPAPGHAAVNAATNARLLALFERLCP